MTVGGDKGVNMSGDLSSPTRLNIERGIAVGKGEAIGGDAVVRSTAAATTAAAAAATAVLRVDALPPTL